MDDNFHYQDKGERYKLRQFDMLAESLTEADEAGMSAEGLYHRYVGVGDNPFTVGADGVPFSA